MPVEHAVRRREADAGAGRPLVSDRPVAAPQIRLGAGRAASGTTPSGRVSHESLQKAEVCLRGEMSRGADGLFDCLLEPGGGGRVRYISWRERL